MHPAIARMCENNKDLGYHVLSPEQVAMLLGVDEDDPDFWNEIAASLTEVHPPALQCL